MPSMLYATDGQCHNAEPGTYGHECGKPATWLGAFRSGLVSGFCDRCKADGWEARQCVSWIKRPAVLDVDQLRQWGAEAAKLAGEVWS